jgi:hypothetical protein
MRTAVFHGQDARATTSARGSSSLLFSSSFPIGEVENPIGGKAEKKSN